MKNSLDQNHVSQIYLSAADGAGLRLIGEMYGVTMNQDQRPVNECSAAQADEFVLPSLPWLRLSAVLWHYPISLFEPTYLVLPKGSKFEDVMMRPEDNRPHVYIKQANLSKLTPLEHHTMALDPNNYEMWEIRAYRAGMEMHDADATLCRVGTIQTRGGLCKNLVYAKYLGRPPFSHA